MQVALPVGQPVERHAIGLAVIALAGIAATPLDMELVMGTLQVPQVTTVNIIPKQNDFPEARGLQPGINSQLFTKASLVTKPLNMSADELWREKYFQKKNVLGNRKVALAESSASVKIQSTNLVSITDKSFSNHQSQEQLNGKNSPEEISPTGELLGQKVIALSLTWEGTPYLWGGQSRSGIDCSALVQTVYAEIGVELPRTSQEQFRQGIGVPSSKLIPGDLVFFSTNGPGASHVGIYIGDEKFISATRHQVEVQKLTDAYWQKTYRGSRRILT